MHASLFRLICQFDSDTVLNIRDISALTDYYNHPLPPYCYAQHISFPECHRLWGHLASYHYLVELSQTQCQPGGQRTLSDWGSRLSVCWPQICLLSLDRMDLWQTVCWMKVLLEDKQMDNTDVTITNVKQSMKLYQNFLLLHICMSFK